VQDTFRQIDKHYSDVGRDKKQKESRRKNAQLLLTNDTYRSLYYQKKAIEDAKGYDHVHDNTNLLGENLKDMDEIEEEMKAIEEAYKLK
jgi:hypothetical protein